MFCLSGAWGRKASGQALPHLFTCILAGYVILASFKPRQTESHGARGNSLKVILQGAGGGLHEQMRVFSTKPPDTTLTAR